MQMLSDDMLEPDKNQRNFSTAAINQTAVNTYKLLYFGAGFFFPITGFYSNHNLILSYEAQQWDYCH